MSIIQTKIEVEWIVIWFRIFIMKHSRTSSLADTTSRRTYRCHPQRSFISFFDNVVTYSWQPFSCFTFALTTSTFIVLRLCQKRCEKKTLWKWQRRVDCKYRHHRRHISNAEYNMNNVFKVVLILCCLVKFWRHSFSQGIITGYT